MNILIDVLLMTRKMLINIEQTASEKCRSTRKSAKAIFYEQPASKN